MVSRRVFVVKLGNFIELRATKEPLKVIVSRLVRKAKRKSDRFWVEETAREKNVVLSQTFVVGGRVIAVMKYTTYLSMYHRLGAHRLNKFGVAELAPEVAEKVLSRAWRVRNGLES